MEIERKTGHPVPGRRIIGRATVALAIVLSAAVSTPVIGGADPAKPAQDSSNPIGVSVEALASLVPAILGAAAGPADVSSPAQASILGQAKQLLANMTLPPQIKAMLQSIIAFLDGSAGGGPKLPGNGPIIAQFLYPSIGKGCISDSADSVATALAVPGPAKLPQPGPAKAQAAFVFTALGTKPPAAQQLTPLTVTWLNLDTRRTETQNLANVAKINPQGPATLSALADTGSGRIVAVISGGLTLQTAPGQIRSCSFLPTVGMFSVG